MAMDVLEALRSRRSIRAFTSEAPGIDILQNIIDSARWAPSWGNTQPWKVTIAHGESLRKFVEENTRRALSGAAPTPDVPMPQQDKWPEENKRRYQDIARRTLESLGIERHDKEGRLRSLENMLNLFGAPALLVISLDERLSLEYAMLDIGAFIHSVCLAAHGRGLGTCIMAVAVQYPDLLRKYFSIPDSRKIVAGIAIGYPDKDNPINHFERTRADLTEILSSPLK